MIATISPIFTSWPSAAFVSSTPAFSATISVETLSVSRVKSASPGFTKSPDFLCQTETTPLEIDSPTAGIFTSTLMTDYTMRKVECWSNRTFESQQKQTLNVQRSTFNFKFRESRRRDRRDEVRDRILA